MMLRAALPRPSRNFDHRDIVDYDTADKLCVFLEYFVTGARPSCHPHHMTL